MCNTTPNQEGDNEDKDYRFIDYRLNQLELKLDTGLNRIEETQETYNIQVMQTLATLQEGQNKTTENLAQIRQRQNDLEEKASTIDELQKAANQNTTNIQATNHRIDVVQKLLFLVGGAALSALFTAAISILQLLLNH